MNTSKDIELTKRQLERIDEIKKECTEGGSVPEPSTEMVVSSLLDTWDAVNDGLYSDDGNSEDDKRMLPSDQVLLGDVDE